jgi:hypothetical protein
MIMGVLNRDLSFSSSPALTWLPLNSPLATSNGLAATSSHAVSSVTSSGTITVSVNTDGGDTNPKIILVEVGDSSGYDYSSNCASSGLMRVVSGTPTDGLTTLKTAKLSKSPGLLIAFSGQYVDSAPLAGTGFTDHGAYPIYNGATNTTRVESKRITSTDAVEATFTPSATSTFGYTSCCAFFLENGAQPDPQNVAWGRG